MEPEPELLEGELPAPSDAAAAKNGSTRSPFVRRAYAMAVVWCVLGAGLAIYSYNQRLVLLEGGAFRVLRNETGITAGLAAMAFGVLWLVMGLVSSLRAARNGAT